MAIRPLDDRILVEPLEAEEKTAGGILLPDTAKEKPQRGKVVAAGPGKLRDSGDRIPLSVKLGDEVLFGRYAGSEIKEGGKEYKVMRESDILAQVVSQQPAACGLRRHHTWRNNCSTTDDARKKLLAGAKAGGRRHQPRADRPERDHRQVLRRPERDEGRGNGVQGDRPPGPVREHGGQAGQRGRVQDQ